MTTDELRLTYVSLALLFPPVPRFSGSALPELYAKLCKRHNLESFEMHGDEGASITTEGLYTLDLKRDRIMLEEDAHRHFDLIKRDFADMTGTIQEELDIPMFVEPRIELRALWAFSDEGLDLGEAIRRGAIKLSDDHFHLLENATVTGVGITIRADIGDDAHLVLTIVPWWRDPSQLSIEAQSWRHIRLESPQVIEQRLDEAYDYLCTRIARFIRSFMA